MYLFLLAVYNLHFCTRGSLFRNYYTFDLLYFWQLSSFDHEITNKYSYIPMKLTSAKRREKLTAKETFTQVKKTSYAIRILSPDRGISHRPF